MTISEVLQAWALILSGRRPSLSIELTKECPLRCPGCYAYGDHHLGPDAPNLRKLSDFKGDELVSRVLQVIEELKPLHLSIVGGDPLVRYRELEILLPELSRRGIHVQVVTSAFRVIPTAWASIPKLCIVISVDGLSAEHDLRRRPATYDRILKNIEGHRNSISIHCTITAQMLNRSGYLADFVDLWSARPEVKRIWFSMYTPQLGEKSNEIIPLQERASVVERLLAIKKYPNKLDMNSRTIRAFAAPPASPGKCTFARTTSTISADLRTHITPCQFGGEPDCSQCGCVASAGLHAISQRKLLPMLRIETLLRSSLRIGEMVRGRKPLPAPRRRHENLVTLQPNSDVR